MKKCCWLVDCSVFLLFIDVGFFVRCLYLFEKMVVCNIVFIFYIRSIMILRGC